MNSLLKRLDDIVRVSMVEGTDHDYGHVKRVLRIATMIAEKENADLELIQVGALLHDIGRAIGEPHEETGAKRAKEILNELGYTSEKIARVERIIRYHDFSSRDRLESLEEKIVWDADKIDGLGATGIRGAYYLIGRRNLRLDNLTWHREQAVPRYNLLNTSSAKRLAEERFNFMMQFMARLEKELTLVDLQENLEDHRSPEFVNNVQ